ncbi:MAG TPA: hypothetical protein VGH27_36005 [Streptosporangiaceae bacterium]
MLERGGRDMMAFVGDDKPVPGGQLGDASTPGQGLQGDDIDAAARSSIRSGLLPACVASSVTAVSMPRGTISPPSMVSSKNRRNRGCPR